MLTESSEAMSSQVAESNIRSVDLAPPPARKPTPNEESDLLKIIRKSPGAPEMREGEWHAIIHRKHEVEKEREVTYCHESLVIGEIRKSEKHKRVNDAENSSLGLLSIEGKLIGFVLRKAEKIVKPVITNLVREHAEKGIFKKYKGLVHKNFKDHNKIKRVTDEIIKVHKSTFEERDCEIILEKVWQRISRE
jgi:hypothetical protein